MLRDSISGHPDLTCLWELYNPKIRYLQELRVRINKHVDREVLAIARAAYSFAQGFTLHGGQQDSAVYKDVLRKLIGKYPDLKVIFLTRKDAFAQACSYMRALKTKRWGLYHFRKDQVKSKDIKPMDFRGDLGRMLQFAEREFKARRKARKQLRDQESHTVFYEDMCDNFDETMAGVFEFLGVKPCTVTPRTIKQAAKPLSEMVVAYEETRNRFERRFGDKFGGRTTLDVV